MNMSQDEKDYIIEDFKCLVDYFKNKKGVCLSECFRNIELYFQHMYQNAKIKIEEKKLIADDEVLTEYKE